MWILLLFDISPYSVPDIPDVAVLFEALELLLDVLAREVQVVSEIRGGRCGFPASGWEFSCTLKWEPSLTRGSPDHDKADDALDVTSLAKGAVYEVGERTYVRKAEVDEDSKAGCRAWSRAWTGESPSWQFVPVPCYRGTLLTNVFLLAASWPAPSPASPECGTRCSASSSRLRVVRADVGLAS